MADVPQEGTRSSPRKARRSRGVEAGCAPADDAPRARAPKAPRVPKEKVVKPVLVRCPICRQDIERVVYVRHVKDHLAEG